MKNSDKHKKQPSPENISIEYSPLTGSKKVYKNGNTYPDIKVPFRKIELSDTAISDISEKNEPLEVYDCSGIYTDPNITKDITKGLPLIRKDWIQ